jgi:DNA primase
MQDYSAFGGNGNAQQGQSRDDFRRRIDTAKELLPLQDLIERLGDWDGQVECGLCPFHDDHSPSFSIFGTYSGPLWKCHAGCGGGDQISYLQVKFKVPRSEAVRMFLNMAGMNQGGGRFSL